MIERGKIFSDLIANDYPKNWLPCIFYEFLHLVNLDLSISFAQLPKKICVKAPYYFDLSDCLSWQLIKFYIYLSHTSCWSLKSVSLIYKSDVSPLDLVGLVYRIPCNDCCCFYIGQTEQKLYDCTSQHKEALTDQDFNSKIYQHALKFDHFPNFNNFKNLVHNCNSKPKHFFLETYFTKTTPNSINDCICILSKYVLFVWFHLV